MSFFPFFKEIAGASGLIIGGGRVAFRKVEKLLSYGPELTVIAPHILPEFQRLSVKLIERDFHENDLAKLPQFVIAASDDRELNKRIALLCQAADIPVNVVDQPDCCTFLFPALVKKGDLSIGISTSGASPSAAVWLKEEIERLLPAHMEQSLEWLRKRRIAAKEQMGEAVLRTRYLKQIFSDCMEGEAAAGIMSAAADEVETEAAAGIGSRTVDEGKVEAAGIGNRAEGGVAAGTEHGVTKEEDAGTGHPAPGCVFLVGAGCGLKGWITVEGLALLQYCDAVVYDDLIDPGLLAEVSPAAEKIYAGKRSRRNSAKQEQIQELLVRLAKESKIVVRLKGGDPFVFGRGGEEIQYLNQHQIPWRVIPGISSALAIPAEAGIPVTHRGVSRSIHIMTAHTRDDVLRRDMEQFAMLEGTLVFLMGLESLAMIVAVLTENGRSVDTPAAVLSGGNAAHPCKIAGNLGNIVERAAQENAVTPAVIIVGDVVALDFCRKESPPLSGVTAGLTGTDDFQDKMRRKLLPLGVDAVSLMRGKCEALSCVVPWAQITDMQEKWIVFTSVQGVRYFFRQRRKEKVDCRRLHHAGLQSSGKRPGRNWKSTALRRICVLQCIPRMLWQENCYGIGRQDSRSICSARSRDRSCLRKSCKRRRWNAIGSIFMIPVFCRIPGKGMRQPLDGKMHQSPGGRMRQPSGREMYKIPGRRMRRIVCRKARRRIGCKVYGRMPRERCQKMHQKICWAKHQKMDGKRCQNTYCLEVQEACRLCIGQGTGCGKARKGFASDRSVRMLTASVFSKSLS